MSSIPVLDGHLRIQSEILISPRARLFRFLCQDSFSMCLLSFLNLKVHFVSIHS